MLSATEEIAAGNIRYWAAYHGTVVDEADPRGLHRVRVHIPNLVEKSAWAFPMTAGGGSPQRGGHLVPAAGADVIVWFIGGDIERPIYAGGWWGEPQAGSEAPTDVAEFPTEAHKIQSMEIGNVILTVDERAGKQALSVRNKITGDAITLDVENAGLQVSMTSAIILRCIGLIDIQAAQVTINDRLVLPDSKGI